MIDTPQTTDEEFVRQCAELSNTITQAIFKYPKGVAVCVLPGVLAAVSMILNIPRETFIAMLDTALEDMRTATSLAQLQRLEEWLVEDILSLTDEEVCAELREDGIDPEAAATAMRARIETIIRQVKDSRDRS